MMICLKVTYYLDYDGDGLEMWPLSPSLVMMCPGSVWLEGL